MGFCPPPLAASRGQRERDRSYGLHVVTWTDPAPSEHVTSRRRLCPETLLEGRGSGPGGVPGHGRLLGAPGSPDLLPSSAVTWGRGLFLRELPAATPGDAGLGGDGTSPLRCLFQRQSGWCEAGTLPAQSAETRLPVGRNGRQQRRCLLPAPPRGATAGEGKALPVTPVSVRQLINRLGPQD